jgi:hypothetical protein
MIKIHLTTWAVFGLIGYVPNTLYNYFYRLRFMYLYTLSGIHNRNLLLILKVYGWICVSWHVLKHTHVQCEDNLLSDDRALLQHVLRRSSAYITWVVLSGFQLIWQIVSSLNQVYEDFKIVVFENKSLRCLLNYLGKVSKRHVKLATKIRTTHLRGTYTTARSRHVFFINWDEERNGAKY